MKLYFGPVSGNSYKLRVLCALLAVPFEEVAVDLEHGEHRSAAFLRLNPRGEVPVLEDGEVRLWDSAACLVYIARRHGGETWCPADPAGLAEVTQWLALAATELQCGLQYARRGVLRGRWTLGDAERAQAFGRSGLRVLEGRLEGHRWLALDRPTIADIACFAYAETAPEAGVPLDPCPRILAWLERCRALPRWPARPVPRR